MIINKKIVTSIICFLGISFLALIFYKNFYTNASRDYLEVNDNEVVSIQTIEYKSEKIKEMLKDLKLNGNDFTLPFNKLNLEEDFQVISDITNISNIGNTQDGLLTYNDRNVALVTLTLNGDISTLFTSKDYEYANIISLSGIHVGSTKNELTSTLPDYYKPVEEKVIEDVGKQEVYFYMDQEFIKNTGKKEIIIITIIDDVVESIGIRNEIYN